MANVRYFTAASFPTISESLAVFIVAPPAPKSTSLLDPHTPIWCTGPSASLKPQHSLFVAPTRPNRHTKNHSRLSWAETSRSHQNCKQPLGASLFFRAAMFCWHMMTHPFALGWIQKNKLCLSLGHLRE